MGFHVVPVQTMENKDEIVGNSENRLLEIFLVIHLVVAGGWRHSLENTSVTSKLL